MFFVFPQLSSVANIIFIFSLNTFKSFTSACKEDLEKVSLFYFYERFGNYKSYFVFVKHLYVKITDKL